MQLEPGELFGIVREIADPNDSGTYYVRAFIRNARSDVLLDTVNLTDRGSGRYSLEWRVTSAAVFPLYIVITTVVYTDSGYTTLSDAYARESETYLVEPRDKHFGGGGSSISYNKVEEIVRRVIGEQKSQEKEVEEPVEPVKQISVNEIVEALEPAIDSAVKKIIADIVSSRKDGLKESDVKKIVTSEFDKGIKEITGNVKDLSKTFTESVDPLENAIKAMPKIDNDAIAKLIKENSTTFDQAFKNAILTIASTLVKAVPTAFIEAVSQEFKTNVEKYGHKPEEKKVSPYAEMSTAELIKLANKKK